VSCIITTDCNITEDSSRVLCPVALTVSTGGTEAGLWSKDSFTGNDTTLEIILFEVLSNRHSSTGRVGVVGRECPQAKAESKKQCVDSESTSVWMGIGWRWSGAHTRGETRGIQREFGSERADTLRRIELVVAQMSSTRLPVYACHKLHLAISPSILHRFSRSQWLRKALEKTF